MPRSQRGPHQVSLCCCEQSNPQSQISSTSSMLASLSRALRRSVTRQRFLMMLGVYCISQALILFLHDKFRQLTDQSILDLRVEGYQEADVRQLLYESGPQGRQQYMWISLVDLGLYIWSYAFLLSGLLTMASAVAPFEFFKYFNLLPCVAVLFDAAENLCVLSMLLTYPDLVDVMAPIVPHVSKWKWNFLYACVCVVGGSGCYCVAVATGLAGKQSRSKSSSSTVQDPAQTQQQQQRQQGRRKRA